MGIVQTELWACWCGYVFIAENGCYEADPNDFGTIHIVKAYHCPNCGNTKNIPFCLSLEEQKKENRKLCHFENNTLCEKCKTEMIQLEHPKFSLFQKGLLCPKCGKKHFKYRIKFINYLT